MIRQRPPISTKTGQKTELQCICYDRSLQKRHAVEPGFVRKTVAGILSFLIGCQDIFVVVAKKSERSADYASQTSASRDRPADAAPGPIKAEAAPRPTVISENYEQLVNANMCSRQNIQSVHQQRLVAYRPAGNRGQWLNHP
jgi:hypothetical protein